MLSLNGVTLKSCQFIFCASRKHRKGVSLFFVPLEIVSENVPGLFLYLEKVSGLIFYIENSNIKTLAVEAGVRGLPQPRHPAAQ